MPLNSTFDGLRACGAAVIPLVLFSAGVSPLLAQFPAAIPTPPVDSRPWNMIPPSERPQPAPGGLGSAPDKPGPSPAAVVPGPPAKGAEGPGGVWHIRSPFTTLSRTRQLLDTIGFEALAGYQTARVPGRLAERPGTVIGRAFTKSAGEGTTHRVEIAVVTHPAGGFELYLTGARLRAQGEEPNPDLGEIESGIERLVGAVAPAAPQIEAAPLDRRRLAYEIYQLSYIEPDRVLALLKALDYSTIEFNDTPGDTVYDKIFTPNLLDKEKVRLPIVIKMISASKTSLQENTAESPSFSMRGSDLLPDLGGAFLHRTTAAEPQNRLLIVYDSDDLPSLERLVNLLREKIDVAAREVLLEALVIEIQSDAIKDLGVSWEFSGSKTDGGYTNSGAGAFLSGALAQNAPLTFLFSRSSDIFNFKAALAALVSVDKAKVLSNPSVLVLDGRQAKIQIGQRIPVVETTVTTTTATQSVLYFPVGIVLNLRPRLNKDGSEVSMQVETIVSSVRQTKATSDTATTVTAPEVNSRQVQTLVRVQNDTPFIIGGLTSHQETKTQTGVPLLSSIPWLGALFRRETVENVRQEIIIVVTPHLVPEDTKAFSYVIPQESTQFDSFGRELLYNAYRIRQQDVFKLDFLRESDAYRSLVRCAQRTSEAREALVRSDPAFAPLLKGIVPGEEILVRRMLWEIVRKTDYGRFVDLDNAILFEDAPPGTGEGGFRLAFLAEKLAGRDANRNTLVLTYNATTAGTPEQPFSQPTAAVSYESVRPETFFSRLSQGNRRSVSGAPEAWTILLTDAYAGTARPLDVLKGIMVLRRIIALNPGFSLTLESFHAGRQIVLPTESELRQAHHLIDAEAARLFYEITSYYPAFEEEFKVRARSLVEAMGGCDWWTASRPTLEAPAPKP